jgi:hypothetical protein
MDRKTMVGTTNLYPLEQSTKVVVVDCDQGDMQHFLSPLELLTRAYHDAMTGEMRPTLSLSQSSGLSQVEEHTVSDDSKTLVPSNDSDDSVSLSDIDDLYGVGIVEDDHNPNAQHIPWMAPASYHQPDKKSYINKSDVFVQSLFQVHCQHHSIVLPTTDDESWTIPDLLHMICVLGQPQAYSSNWMMLLTLTSHPFRVVYASDVMFRKRFVGTPLYECVSEERGERNISCTSNVMEQPSSLLDGREYEQLKIIPVLQHKRDHQANVLYYVIFLPKISLRLGRISPQY